MGAVMGAIDLSDVLGEWRDRAEEFDREEAAVEEKQDSKTKGDIRETVRPTQPELHAKCTRECIAGVEDAAGVEELLAAVAAWRSDAEECKKRSRNGDHPTRNSIYSEVLGRCADELAEALPSDEFPECRWCELRKVPMKDGNYSKEFRWECPECGE